MEVDPLASYNRFEMQSCADCVCGGGLMAKQKRKQAKKKPMMQRSDIPYSQRISMRKQADISYNRERSARNYMYCLCKELNETEGI